jgi:hypothetical protein
MPAIYIEDFTSAHEDTSSTAPLLPPNRALLCLSLTPGSLAIHLAIPVLLQVSAARSYQSFLICDAIITCKVKLKTYSFLETSLS